MQRTHPFSNRPSLRQLQELLYQMAKKHPKEVNRVKLVMLQVETNSLSPFLLLMGMLLTS